MTLRLSDEDDAALEAAAVHTHLSKHEVVVRALRAYTSGRQRRVTEAMDYVVTRDAEFLDRLGKA